MVRALRFAVMVVLSFAVANAVVAGPGEPGAGNAPAADANETAAKAVNDLMLGDYAAAEAAATGILKSTPGHAEALFVRGGVKLRRDKAYAEALADLQAAIKAGHDNPTARWYCFECRVALKDFEGALADAEKAAEFAPKSALAKRRVGDALRLIGRHQEAIKVYTSALELDKGEYMARLGRARSYLGLANVRTAQTDAESVTATAPGHAGGWELLGECHMFYRRYPEAGTAFARAAKIEPTMLTAWDNLAICLLRQGQNEEARLPATKAAELAPSDARILTNLAICLKELGKHEEAVRRLSSALLHEKPTALRWQLRAESHAALKKYELAATDYAASLALDAEDNAVWGDYADVLRELNHHDAVLVVLDRLVAELPDNAFLASERIVTLLDMGRLDDAQRALEELSEAAAGHPRGLFARCDLLEKQRRFNEMLPALDALQKAMPQAPVGVIGRAACLAQMGKYEEALAVFPTGDDNYLTSFRASLQADIHAVYGRWTQAEEVLRNGLAKDADNTMLLRALAEVYLETGQLNDAYRVSVRLVRDEPHMQSNWLTHAKVLREQGDLAEARRCLDRAVEANPWSAGARNARGYFLLRQKEDAAALADIEAALKLQPHHRPALLNLAILKSLDPLTRGEGLAALAKVEAENEHRRKNGDDPLEVRLYSARVCAVKAMLVDADAVATLRRAALDHLKAWRDAGRVLSKELRTETDLSILHGDAEFEALFEPAEKK